MKKFLLSLTVVLAFVVYVAYERSILKSTNNTVTTTPTDQTPVYPTPQTKALYKDGQYMGMVADAFYGPFQVNAVISGGKITDIIFLQYPNDRRTSIQINTQAMPIMKQEAIQVQSANVNIVSGATQSSLAYRQTLASALAQAKN
ncbi:MAG: FMN-binding protein [Candidatus Doudnabacteria bacterium]